MSAGGVLVGRREEYRAYRISPGDTNRMVLLHDPIAHGLNFVAIIEIFDPRGRTPPNRHDVGQELFYVLKGQGTALANGARVPLRPGDSIVLMPGTDHELENDHDERLYCLTFMAPNDKFAELILAGEEVPLDDEDWSVILGASAWGTACGAMR